MDLQLGDKTALITGASAGIGYEAARTLAEEGVQTVVVARREANLQALAMRIESAGGKPPLVIVDDATQEGAATRIYERVTAELGRLDILINNLGQARPFDLDTPDGDWDEAFNLNFSTSRKLATAFLPGMQERKFGRIINLASTLEPFGISGSHPSKAALVAWAKGLSRVVARDDVTVNCISPGILLTEQITEHFFPRVFPTDEDQKRFVEEEIPAGHFGEPSDAAQLIAFLCSPKAHYITGQRICVDGGWYRHI